MEDYEITYGSSILCWAEYHFMTSIPCELKWLKGLLILGILHSHVISLFCDSKPALHMTYYSVFDERNKHIEVDCDFV